VDSLLRYPENYHGIQCANQRRSGAADCAGLSVPGDLSRITVALPATASLHRISMI